jgi:RND family efflux transporter MFP subunit
MTILTGILRYATIAAAIAGIIAITGISRLQASKRMPTAGDPPLPPAAKPWASSVSATGIIEALSENIAIGVPQPGIVTELFVEVNDAVKSGDPLFRIDDRDLRAQALAQEARIAAAKASIQVAEAQFNKSRSQLARLEAVSDRRAVSTEDLENKRQDVALADAQVAAARAEAAAAESDLQATRLLIERLTVRAPRDGSIIQCNIRPGEYAAANAEDPALILGDTSRLQIRADVDEQNATRIRPGQRGMASLKGDPSVQLPLEFVRLEPFVIPKVSLTGASTERVDTRVLQVIFAFDKPQDTPVYVGQQVDVFIEAPQP